MKLIKKSIFITAIFLCCYSYGQIDFGGGIATSNDGNSLGFNARVFYHANQTSQQQGHFRFGPSFTYYEPGSDKFSKWQYWELNVDAQYLLGKKKVRGYADIGLGFGYLDIEYNQASLLRTQATGAKIGLNLGVGLQVFIKKFIVPFAEMKTVLGAKSRIEVVAGLLFHISRKSN